MRFPSIWRRPGMPAHIATTVAALCGFSLLLSTVPLWASRGGAGASGAGLVNAVMLLTTVVAQFFVPATLARFGHARVLATGLVLLGVPSLGYAFSDGLALILGLSVLRGVGFAIITVAGSAITARLVPSDELGSAVGVYGLATAAPMALLLPLSVPLLDHGGPWAVFGMGAIPVFGVPAAVALGRRVDALPQIEVIDPTVDPAGGWWPLIRVLLAPVLILLTVTIAGGSVLTFLPQVVDSSLLAALALMCFTVSATIGRWRIGAPADRYGARRFVFPLLSTMAVAMGALAWWVSADQAVTMLLLAAVAIVGLGYGSLQNLTLVLAFRAAGTRRINQASAGWNMGFDAGTGLGSMITGYVATATSFGTAYALLAVLLVAGIGAIRGLS